MGYLELADVLIVILCCLYAPESLKYNSIKFNSRDTLDFFGPAVVTNLPLYQSSSLSISKADLAPGIFLTDRVFQVYSGQRSGSAISIAPEGNILLQGILVDLTDEPLVYEFGNFISLEDTSKPGKPFFTNKNGRFVKIGRAHV